MVRILVNNAQPLGPCRLLVCLAQRTALTYSEAEISKPMLYDQGWGKKQTFCLYVAPLRSPTLLISRSFGRDGATDVSEAYIADWDGDCRTRRAAKHWDETELHRVSISARLYIQIRVLTISSCSQLHSTSATQCRMTSAQSSQNTTEGKRIGSLPPVNELPRPRTRICMGESPALRHGRKLEAKMGQSDDCHDIQAITTNTCDERHDAYILSPVEWQPESTQQRLCMLLRAFSLCRRLEVHMESV